MARRKPFADRVAQADRIAAGAYELFQQAAEDLELASRVHREAYDDIQVELDRLTNLQADARRHGERASKNAQKLREFFI